MTLTVTLDQARDNVVGALSVKGIPNAWWPLPQGNDCLAFLLYHLAVRSRAEVSQHLISISAFRRHFGWEEIATSELQPGDLPVWNFSGGSLPEHIEYGYSFDHKPGAATANTISANTGPKPGVPVPRGVWQKTRPITGSLLFGIRPPYRDAADALTKARKAEVRLVAQYLNTTPELNGQPNSAAEQDGRPGSVYWTLVQTWGRLHGIYGPTFKIDGVPGPRTRQVEDTIYVKAKAAAARR